MTDERDTEQADLLDNVRINVYISPAAREMMLRMGRVRYPNLKRSGGLIVDEALRKMYAEFKRSQSRARKQESAEEE